MVSLPDVIPSLRGWTAARGVFSLVPGARLVAGGEAAARAGLLAEELAALLGTDVPVVADGATAGDVELAVDRSRGEELGAEGYELTIGSTVRVVAATPVGVLHGTRTVAQLLVQQRELPAGSTVDVPAYAERGVTVCASQIHISPRWIDRLLEDMSWLKLNSLLLELKVASHRHPQTVTWSYYTPEQIRELVTKAQARGIEVIPEINSPGHMAVWLENLPHLQLRDRHGNRDEVRLDITTPEAFAFYTSLVDEHLEAFSTTGYWHMGADEYMINSAFENFPQVEAYAKERFGPDATPQDAFVDFVNRVSAYVQERHGRTLRIWNDGLTGANTVPLDPRIVVEHWQNTPVGPAELLAAGHRVMNASYSLYAVRGGLKMDTAHLYAGGWHPGQFYGGWTLEPGTPGLTGAKISLWPDSGAAQTEHEVEDEVLMPLRLVAQATWTGEYAFPEYAQFEAASRRVGRPPLWENVDRRPLADGTYTITTADGGVLEADGARLRVRDGATAQWSLRATDDGYYRIASTDSGHRLDVVDGQRRLNVPVESGAPVVAGEPAPSNTQKWQLVADGEGVEIVNASTQQRLAVADGVVQLPPDRTATRWTLTAVSLAEPTERPTAAPAPTRRAAGPIEQWRVSVADVSSEETGEHPGLASFTLDGSPQTMWHSDWAVAEAPHHITFDLGTDYRVSTLVYTPRQTVSRNGVLKDYAAYVSAGPGLQGRPAATGTLADSLASSTIELGDALGRYVTLVYLDSHNDAGAGTHASAAGVAFTGTRAGTLQP